MLERQNESSTNNRIYIDVIDLPLSKNDVLLGGRLKQKINDVQFLQGCEVKVLRFERQNESFKKKGTSSESWIGKKIQIPMTRFIYRKTRSCP